MPCSAAIRLATGETFAPSAGAVAVGCAEAPSAGAGGAAGALASAPAVMRAITCPTETVSPSGARISTIWPVAGAGSSMSTLSVEISTTVSPCLTESPTLTAHSRIVPSVTDSPPVGVTMSIVLPTLASVAATPSASVAAPATSSSGVAGGDSADTGVASVTSTAPPLAEISASTAPTATVSPSAAWILTIVPEAGEGTSASTLSVEISTSVSSAATLSPSCLCHSSTVPSATESPIAGMTTSTVLVTPVIYIQL